MSESEKKKRLAYRKRRIKLIVTQFVVAIIISLVVAFCAFAFMRIDNEYQVAYKEGSTASYKVYYNDNEFFEKEEEQGQVFIASLIDSLDAKFTYTFELESDKVRFYGNYSIISEFVIIDKNTKKAIITKDFSIKESISLASSDTVVMEDKKVTITEESNIDYYDYNNYAQTIINTYLLTNVECYLNVYLNVNVSGNCADFDNRNLSSHSTSLKVPLSQDIVEINITTSLPHSENSVVLCSRQSNRDTLKWIMIIGAIVDVLLIIEIIIFIFTTRNYDINYEIKVKRIVSAYKSYIQKILTEFNIDGYQVLKIDSFTEMLDIRDTINLPILMRENADKTCTTFIIPANNNILYMHEIKVEDYDEIYGITNSIVEDLSVTEDVTVSKEETTAENVSATEDLTKEDTLEVLDGNDFKNGPKYNYSFLAKLHLTNDETRGYYEEISKFVQSYGLKVSRSWSKERVQLGKKTYAILTFKGLKLTVSFALNPNDYLDTKYKLVDVSDSKKFAQTPAQMKVTSLRKVNWVKELFNDMLTKDGVENKNLTVEVPKITAKTKNELLEENLIKIQ